MGLLMPWFELGLWNRGEKDRSRVFLHLDFESKFIYGIRIIVKYKGTIKGPWKVNDKGNTISLIGTFLVEFPFILQENLTYNNKLL